MDSHEEKTKSPSDRSLLGRYRRGDADAATELYLRYAERLKMLARAKASNQLQREVDAEDMIQSVFRTFFRRAADGQYDIPEGDELWRLLLVIGLNKIRSLATYHRADKRDIQKTIVGEGAEYALSEHSESDESALAILKMTIDEMLTLMPAEYREIVDMRIAGFAVGEIAEKSGRAKRSVERILQEFRQKLDELIHGDE
jgi:RNA polymerase sigma-70 factor (ECF subfamily)